MMVVAEGGLRFCACCAPAVRIDGAASSQPGARWSPTRRCRLRTRRPPRAAGLGEGRRRGEPCVRPARARASLGLDARWRSGDADQRETPGEPERELIGAACGRCAHRGRRPSSGPPRRPRRAIPARPTPPGRPTPIPATVATTNRPAVSVRRRRCQADLDSGVVGGSAGAGVRRPDPGRPRG